MRTLLILLALVACKKSSTKPPPDAEPAPTVRRIDPAANLEIVSEDVAFTHAGRQLQGTITRPADAALPGPAVLLIAGSGPTDRDWTSALLPGKNGSGKQIAEELARHGAVTYRFDKSGSGTNPGPQPPDVTFDLFRDEALAALEVLLARPDVDPEHVFVLGNSEGGIHANRVAQEARGKVAGVIFLASASRSMMETMLGQVAGNFRDNTDFTEDQIAAQMAPIRQALEEFVAGKDVDPTKASDIPQLQQFVAGLTSPVTANLMRPYLTWDNAVEAKRLAVPALVCNGQKDLQVDPELDARRLHAALVEAGVDATLLLFPDANHVFKHEPKTLEQLHADVMNAANSYTADGVPLDPAFVQGLLGWLAVQTGGPWIDTFDSADDGPDWTETGPGYAIVDGALHAENAHNHPLWLNRKLPRDVRIELTAWSDSPEGDLKIELFGDGKSFDPNQGSYTSTGYVLVFGGWKNTKSIIARMDEHGKDVVSRTSPKVEPGKKYRWTITRRGNVLDWKIDGAPFLRMEDASPLEGEGHEHFAFDDWETSVHFDDLSITAL